MGKNSRKNLTGKIFVIGDDNYMKYVTIPNEISIDEIDAKSVLSPSLYEKIICKNSNTQLIKTLIKEPIKGKEVGSSSYIDTSEYYFIRTSSLKGFRFLIQQDKQSPIPIKPQTFQDQQLSKNDILYSKDSNIGECCIVESDSYKKYMMSGGILKLIPKKNPLYIFAFLKHSFVKSQLNSITAKGATIKHSKLNVLSCIIPFPNGNNKDEIINMVEKITKEIISLESSITKKDRDIYQYIHDELSSNQSNSKFVYHEPTIEEILLENRLDAGTYSKEFKEKKFLLMNYSNGCKQLNDHKFFNFDVKPGSSLELKIIRTRIDSDYPREGFYTLLMPKDISKFGTLKRLRYMGTAKQIPELKFGDIVLGESGTWRSFVLLSNHEKCITNAHGSRLRQNDGNVELSIYVRCILSWYKKFGLFDFIAVGGSGGHISPSYFGQILIPLFPDNVKKKIVKLYFDQHIKDGVWQLDEKRSSLLKKLDTILDHIINDEEINVDDYT